MARVDILCGGNNFIHFNKKTKQITVGLYVLYVAYPSNLLVSADIY